MEDFFVESYLSVDSQKKLEREDALVGASERTGRPYERRISLATHQDYAAQIYQRYLETEAAWDAYDAVDTEVPDYKPRGKGSAHELMGKYEEANDALDATVAKYEALIMEKWS